MGANRKMNLVLITSAVLLAGFVIVSAGTDIMGYDPYWVELRARTGGLKGVLIGLGGLLGIVVGLVILTKGLDEYFS